MRTSGCVGQRHGGELTHARGVAVKYLDREWPPAPPPSEGPGHTLHVRGLLRVALPDGRVLIEWRGSAIGAGGESVVLLGGSGAGKSTFARVLFEREELDAAGFEVVRPPSSTSIAASSGSCWQAHQQSRTAHSLRLAH